MKYFFLLLISINSFAGIVTYDVYGSDKKAYSYSDVCSDTYGGTFPLVEMKNSTILLCMGKKTSVVDFCKKKVTKNFIRGFISSKKKQVICQSGNRIVFKYNCKSNKAYCASTSACKVVQSDLAHSLNLIHGSIVENNLNCYFSADNEEITLDRNINL